MCFVYIGSLYRSVLFRVFDVVSTLAGYKSLLSHSFNK